MQIGDIVGYVQKPRLRAIFETRLWYFVRCQTRTDQQVIDGFEAEGIETYYPRLLEMADVPRRELSKAQRACGHSIQKPRVKPLLPRYVLIFAELRAFDWQSVFRRIGAAGFAFHNNAPVALRPGDYDKIRGRENGGLIDGKEKTAVVFNVGDGVTVTSGPFASFDAVVEEALEMPIGSLDPTTRLRVAVAIFGRSTPVELELWQVAKHA